MKRKLFANMKRMTTMFSVAILAVTLTSLGLRLTVLRDMSVIASPPSASISEPGRPADTETSYNTLFPYSMSREVYFEAVASKGDFNITNPVDNEFYMTVNIISPDQERLNLYASGFIRPGETRKSAALHLPLPDGEYRCIAEVTAFDPETLRPSGSEEQEITLYIGDYA